VKIPQDLPASQRALRGVAIAAIAAVVVIGGLLLLAPYIPAALQEVSSIISQLGSNHPSNATTTTDTGTGCGSACTTATTSVQCAAASANHVVSAPDIHGNSAKIAYPTDYCTLAQYALTIINQDRANNATGAVTLGFNQAAQQHADSMLYYNYFSHFDTQGDKPYMRYSLLGGLGADFENVATISYTFGIHYDSLSSKEDAIQVLEHSMIYNDSACCGNGHRDNILNHLHNVVSIGVAYSANAIYFDEEFENDYVNLNFASTGASASNPYYVTMTGTPQGGPPPNAIYVAVDNTPSPETPAALNAGPHEYGPGTLVGGVLPPSLLGGCGQFANGVTVCADKWQYTSSQMDIRFSLKDLVNQYGSGVYTIYLVTGSSTATAITSISVFVP
jgi:uncharacterized protein YkwD